MIRLRNQILVLGLGFLAISNPTIAQPPGGDGPGFPGGGRGGFPGGPPGMQERKILKNYDKDNNGWLNNEERSAARESLKKDGQGTGRGFGPPRGGPGGFGRTPETKPGPKVNPSEVTTYPDKPFYDPTILRTIFIEFENKDWEKELEEFHGTDVDVPATMIVDGKKYPLVGVHFRGMSSYMMVRAGQKRSLNIAVDLANSKQRIGGYKTLNLLNAHEDPTFLSTVLYSQIARQYIPAPKANLVKVVINGESWGLYTSVQQFNKEFLTENFQSSKGTRWKVKGSPGGGGGLEYIGDKIEDYKRRYEIKSNDDEKAWKALINLCKVLNTTPPDQLEAALKPIIDIDGLLWFLALDVSLINCDGYWIRASDYSIYLDEKGKFHIIPHDMNEAFRTPQGPGFGGGPGGFRGPGGGGRGFPMFGMGQDGLIPPPIAEELKLTDAQKKQLGELQKQTNSSLETFLTDAQKKQLKEFRDRTSGAGFPGGPGGGGPRGPGGQGMATPANGLELDPLTGLNDTRKPLRSKVLAVEDLREKYLDHVRTIGEKSLDWKSFGPVVASFRSLIEKEVEQDTRKLEPFESFLRTTAETPATGGNPRETPLRTFSDQRSKYLREYKEKKVNR